MAGDRLDQRRIEVATGLRRRELDDPVGGVRGDAEAEPGEHSPVDALAGAEQIVDRGDEEGEVEHELAHPLAELRQSLGRLQVVEADQVDEQEGGEERDHDPRCPWQRPVAAAEAAQEVSADEEDRDHLGEGDLPGDVPEELLEAHREDGREEQKVGDAAGGHQAVWSSSSESSSTRLRREMRSRSSGRSAVPFSCPARQRASSPRSASRIASVSSGGTTTPASASRIRFAAAPAGGTAARIGRSAARYSKSLPGSTGVPRSPACGRSSSSASESRW